MLKTLNRREKDKGLTRCDPLAIFWIVLQDHRQTLNQLAEYETGDRPFSRTTVLRELKKAGHTKRPTTGKPILKPLHYTARLKWATGNKYWPVEYWDRVIWFDKSLRILNKGQDLAET
jgi:hypothetical protein